MTLRPYKLSEFWFAALVVLAASCGSKSESFLQASKSGRQDVVIYLSGGYRSCETLNFIDALEPVRDEIRGMGLSHRLVYSCYTQFRNLKFKSSYRRELRPATLDEVTAEVEKQLLESTDQQLVVIGHSYGGWAGMEVLERLPDTRSADLLATIDAISPKHCGIGNVASTIAQTASGLGEGSAGCKQFPLDWPTERTRGLSQRSGSFWNFYQTLDSTIHSGAAEGARNQVMIYRAADDQSGYGNVHRTIDNDPRVWNQLQERILQSLR
jgi:pimeloyl-ACP methyl ester carboxylesterase